MKNIILTKQTLFLTILSLLLLLNIQFISLINRGDSNELRILLTSDIFAKDVSPCRVITYTTVPCDGPWGYCCHWECGPYSGTHNNGPCY